MIARFQVPLPYRLYVPVGLVERRKPLEVTIGNLAVRIYAPYRSSLEPGDVSGESSIPPSEIILRLRRAQPQIPEAGVTIDGEPAIIGDALQIDFQKESFDRSEGADDPPIDLVFKVANSLLLRLRAVAHSGWIKPLDKIDSPWQIEYLKDDGTRVPPSNELAAGRFSVVWSIRHISISTAVWDGIAALPVDYQGTPANDLIIDAYALLPQVGPAVVLAFAALETRISRALDLLASMSEVNDDLWTWINGRGHYSKEPSTAEQLDVVLRALTGSSLKDDNVLWEAFQNLRKVRNSFVHDGRPTLGYQVVEPQRAAQLVEAAEKIIDWIEGMLPESEKRPRLESPVMTKIEKMVIRVPDRQ